MNVNSEEKWRGLKFMIERVLESTLNLLLTANAGRYVEASTRIIEAVGESLGEEGVEGIVLPKMIGTMGLKVEEFVHSSHPFFDQDGDFGLLMKILGGGEDGDAVSRDVFKNVTGYKSDDCSYPLKRFSSEKDGDFGLLMKILGGGEDGDAVSRDVFKNVTGYKSDDCRFDEVEVVLRFKRGESLGVSLVDERKECGVKNVGEGGIADLAGLKADDIIIGVGGDSVESVEELQSAMASWMEEEDSVTLLIRRYDVAVGLRDSILPVLVQGVGSGLPKAAMVHLLKTLVVGVNDGSLAVGYDVVVDTLSRLASSQNEGCKESLLKCLVELVQYEGDGDGDGEGGVAIDVKLTVCNLLSISVNYFEASTVETVIVPVIIEFTRDNEVDVQYEGVSSVCKLLFMFGQGGKVCDMLCECIYVWVEKDVNEFSILITESLCSVIPSAIDEFRNGFIIDSLLRLSAVVCGKSLDEDDAKLKKILGKCLVECYNVFRSCMGGGGEVVEQKLNQGLGMLGAAGVLDTKCQLVLEKMKAKTRSAS
ncbi:hypothetical protein TL16_g12033 [Triparma laevis f. inornata]|uniref:PDZ domain-containing protein n=1 Tax=Triparma laevis f. inornata TaxID=1714386 RepID=A0A9W7EVH3_9STRA|nr:hypothetical protein TL16_g12033 [Triparma laevis f. inornata]